MGGRREKCDVNMPRVRRQYVWQKTGGLCWYCGARLYYREEADTEVKKRLVFTADHLHPRAHGGRGRANKVPACKYCNSVEDPCTDGRFRWPDALRAPRRSRIGQPWGCSAIARVVVAGRFNFSTTWGFDPAPPQIARGIGFITRPAPYA